MAVKTAPKPRKPGTKGAPPTASATPATTPANTERPASNELVPLNFKVPEEFHQDFKQFATMHRMSMVAVLREAFEDLKNKKGSA